MEFGLAIIITACVLIYLFLISTNKTSSEKSSYKNKPYSRYESPSKYKGDQGEAKIRSTLRSHLNGNDYYLLCDLILPIAGGSTQIDHVVISKFGIFVIETKNMSGWIFGDHDIAK